MIKLLFLPDQDILMRYIRIKFCVADEIYNFDARYHAVYAKTAGLIWRCDWIIQIRSLCGKDKPWKKMPW